MLVFFTFFAALVLQTETNETITDVLRSGTQPLHPAVRAHMHAHSGLCLVTNPPPLTSNHRSATKSTGESYSGREGVVVVPDTRSVWHLPFPLLSAERSNCIYRRQRRRTQFEFPPSLSAQSCMPALTSAPPDARRPVPVDAIQERGPPTVGPPVPMLRIAPRLSCPRAHWSFLFLEFLGLPVHWMSVYHQSSYVKILTATWWY